MCPPRPAELGVKSSQEKRAPAARAVISAIICVIVDRVRAALSLLAAKNRLRQRERVTLRNSDADGLTTLQCTSQPLDDT